MPNPSHRLLSEKDRKELLIEFKNMFADLNNNQLSILLQAFLTENEVMMLAKRLAIIKCLVDKLPYEEIKSIYRVGNSTIARLQAILQYGDQENQRLLEKLSKRDLQRRQQAMEEKKKAGGYKWGKMVYARKKRK